MLWRQSLLEVCTAFLAKFLDFMQLIRVSCLQAIVAVSLEDMRPRTCNQQMSVVRAGISRLLLLLFKKCALVTEQQQAMQLLCHLTLCLCMS